MNKRKKKTIANIVIVAFIVCGLCWIASNFVHIGGQYTNNAQIRQNIIPVASRVQGYIKEIRFEDFQNVHKGDTLVIIEGCEYRLRLAQAKADYQNALVGKTACQTAVSTLSNNLAVSDASMQEVEILLANAEADYHRFKNLLCNKAVTQQQFEQVETKYKSLKAKLETMKRQKQSTSLAKTEQNQRLGQNEMSIEVAKAALELAELNLSHTIITAPCDGTMCRKNIQVGELISPGRLLCSIVDKNKKWVVANYRETQLKSINPGDKVKISVDAFPDVAFEGRVESISNATGASFSISSPDNSVGNFVKVEQRIPIKIVFTENNEDESLNRLSDGMNAECKILK